MRLLLDECIDRRLAAELKGHSVRTAPQEGWAGFKNGQLLSKAEKHFDVFVTIDQNLSAQQNLSKYDIAVLVLSATTNRFDDLKVLTPKILSSISFAKKGHALKITP